MFKQFIQFIGRSAINYVGIIFCISLGIISIEGAWWGAVIYAALLSAINAVIKPIIIIFTLPLIMYTLGFFLILINGFIVYITSLIYGPVDITNFWYAIVAGIVLGLLNYIVTIMYERLSNK